MTGTPFHCPRAGKLLGEVENLSKVLTSTGPPSARDSWQAWSWLLSLDAEVRFLSQASLPIVSRENAAVSAHGFGVSKQAWAWAQEAWSWELPHPQATTE